MEKNQSRIVIADIGAHPFFNTLDIKVSSSISEQEVDYWLTEYCVRHSFSGSNRTLRSPHYLKNMFSGERLPKYCSFDIDVDFIGELTKSDQKNHRIEVRIINQIGKTFPVVEEFKYEGTKTSSLKINPGQSGYRRYINARVSCISLPQTEDFAKLGLFQLEEILKRTQEKYPGKDPLEKGKIFLSDFYCPDFKFYPQ